MARLVAFDDKCPVHRQNANMLPNFIIVGSMRCGTSSLSYYLRQHPDVYMAPGKELNYFNNNFDKGLDWYESQFRDAETHHAVGEATPSYIHDGIAVSRISEVLPAIRMVAILRNPVERTYSDYLMAATRGREHRTFEEAVDEERHNPHRTTSYVDRSRYLHQVKRLAQEIPGAQLHVMITEQLAVEPVPAYQGLCRFLDVDPTILPVDLGRRVNPYMEFRSIALRRALKKLRPGLIRRGLEAANAKREAGYPPMNPATADTLRSLFEPEVGPLSEYLQMDLSKWW